MSDISRILRQRAVPLGALAVIAVGGGLLWGRASLPPSETEVIDRIAAGYVTETGGALTDCAARPGPGAAWLTVYCEGDHGRFAYPVDRAGRSIEVETGS